MSILDTFFILFESDSSKLDEGLKESEKKAEGLIDKLKGVDKESSKVGKGLFDVVGKAAGLLGVGVSIGALVAGVKATAATYDELGKLATRFRSTADAVDEYIDASELLGLSKETSVGALKALDTAVQDTALGMGRAGKVFEELGIKATDAAGKARPTMEVMGELAAKMQDMEQGKKIRVMERLGLDPAMLKLFNADFVALQKRMADVDKASGFNLDQAVKRANEYTKASKGLTLEVNTLRMFLDKMSEGLKVAALPYFTKAMETATRYVRMFVDYLLRHPKVVEGAIIAIAAAISYFMIPAAIKGALAMWAMIAPFALIGAAVLAVGVAFALLYDDVMNFIEGGDSMIGKIVARWPIVGEILKAIGAEFVFFWDIAKAVWNFLIGMFDDPAAAFEKFKSDIAAGVDGLIGHFPGLKEVVGEISDAFTTAADVVTGAWDAIIAAIRAAIAAVLDGINTVSSAFNAAKSFLGFGGGDSSGSIAAGKSMLGQAAASPLTSQTSNSISNTVRGGRNTSVSVGKVEVKTAATDAEGISKAIGGSIQTQMRQAVNNYDDGVLA
jgi:uncharacterized protein (DUF1778 family)